MIYTIVGTDKNIREKAYKELATLGTVTASIYNEQISTLEPLIEATSLFGEKIIVNVQQVMEDTSVRERFIALLPAMKTSINIFIVDEPFADASRIKLLTKFSEKVFNGKVEKEKLNPFTLATYLGARKKKELWVEWMRLRDLDQAESLHGVLWWKWKTIWADVIEGKPSKYTLRECEDIGRELILAPVRAHNGERGLREELERVVLSI